MWWPARPPPNEPRPCSSDMNAKDNHPDRRAGEAQRTSSGMALTLACLVIIATYAMMIDLKGVSTDEGIRLGIINGGRPYVLNAPPTEVSWADVMKADAPFAYQPLYFLIQHTLMGVAQTHDVVFLRLLNLLFLWIALQGLLALSRDWRLLPRLFLVGAFSFNAYLLMHVLQIREYTAGVAFYVWSTWFVLRLDTRVLARPWADVGWFAGYGVLLVLGFYTQSWVVFPAVGQCLFLIARRRESRWRFYALLALSYLIVLVAAEPYLQHHAEKVNVGRWGVPGTNLLAQLSDGFHLVLAGHPAGRVPAADFLFWFWLLVLATGGGLLLCHRRLADGAGFSTEELRRQVSLMLLSLAVPLAFQVYYFYTADNLSVWPRYFVIHYFFLVWLLALAVKHLHDLSSAAPVARRTRLFLRGALAAIIGVLLVSACFQVRSYYRDPLFDTGLSRASNWRTLAAEISRVTRPDDVLLTHEFINRATLTFTRPVSNRVLMLQELETSDLGSADRIVYLESSANIPARPELAARLAKLGFGTLQEIRLHATDRQYLLPDWRLLVFQRR